MAAPLAAHLGRGVARRWSSSNPRRIAALSLLAVLILIVIATGPVGIGLAGLAAVVGLVPIALRVRRGHLMASLLVPVLLTYLGFAARGKDNAFAAALSTGVAASRKMSKAGSPNVPCKLSYVLAGPPRAKVLS